MQQPGEEHGLDVGDELGLPDQPVQAGALLEALDVRDRQAHQQVHQDDADEDDEEENHEVAGEGE